MLEGLDQFLAIRGLPPHGYCLFWEPSLIWSHVVADTIIAAAYFSIPFLLWRLLRIRQDIEFGWMVGLFALFILACGMTHVMGIITLWIPAYGWEALIKIVTAAASLGTAALLIPLLPKLVAIPSPSTLQKANEALLAEAREREKAEAMLRQSQKLEAIGQLTGGVAHDFNNLLGVIIGNLDRAQRKADDPASSRQAIADAVTAAERAAAVTDQLLAFARQQPLQSGPHDLRDIVAGIEPLIRQIADEKIAVSIELADEKALAVVDRNQVENALLNLAINARDAVSGSGRIVIAAGPSAPGTVELSVSDDGIGMDAETLARAADPFFTTKPVGKGSGLGLSQVFGLAQQMGGRVEMESALGEGTRVRLIFPALQAAEA